MPSNVRPGVAFDEPLIFERGSDGRSGASLAAADVPEVDPAALLGAAYREKAPPLPAVSEPEAFRHFVRLSQQNFAIDLGMYPLGSCTMKYNPKVNEWAARLAGFARLHPSTEPEILQGALELMHRLEQGLAEVCGMDHVSLQPAAGAQGELAGLMMIRAYHRAQGRSPKKVLIPETAHGTNPASCALNGFDTVSFPATEAGIVSAEMLAPYIDDGVAAVMITNPNTVGLFESELPRIAQMVHDKGALVYGDGANLNAIMGKTRPGDIGIDVMQFNLHKTFTTPHGGGGPGCGPVAYKAKLDPYAPAPVVGKRDDGSYFLDYARPETVGRVRTFYGNFGMMVRAYTYLREMGAEGLKRATELAVLNANYLRARLGERWHVAYPTTCMHEVVISDRHLKATGVTTLDVAKRLLDYGFHPPTVYFPLVSRARCDRAPRPRPSRRSTSSSTRWRRSTRIARAAELVKAAPHSRAYAGSTRPRRPQAGLRWSETASIRALQAARTGNGAARR